MLLLNLIFYFLQYTKNDNDRQKYFYLYQRIKNHDLNDLLEQINTIETEDLSMLEGFNTYTYIR